MPQVQATLTTHNVFYSFIGLIRGTVGSGNVKYPTASPYCRRLEYQNDWGNTGSPNIALIGSDVASPTVAKGMQFHVGDSDVIQSDWNDVDLNARGLVCDTDGTIVNIVWDMA